MLVKQQLGIFLIMALLIGGFNAKAQFKPVDVSHSSIYEFLDEMANLQLIELQDLTKPWPRSYIVEKLQQIEDQQSSLNQRQRAELEFYMKDYGKELHPGKDFDRRLDLFYYKDSLFTITVNPIGGLQYFLNDSAGFYHRWNGAEAWATVGDHLAVWASLRDNHETTFLSDEDYLNQRMGANYKYTGDGGGDYSEMRGGISYSWKWGQLGVAKDHFLWGQGYNGANIFSGHTPSFAHINMQLKPADWFEFNWVHGWLVSEVTDTALSYTFTNAYGTDSRELFHDKFLAANMFTFRPFKNFFISAGNSVIYSDNGPQLQYMIPVMFYKSVDHTYNATDKEARNAGQNSQMFFSLSSRNIKHVHLYSTLFVEELSVDRFFDDEEFNFWSLKLGSRVSDLIPNTQLTLEYTKSMPLTYQHHIPTTTFESNGYNMGHYLRDNSREYFAALDFYPLRGLKVHLHYLWAQRGKDYDSLGGSRLGNPFLDSVEWENKTLYFRLRYQIIHDGYLLFSVRHSNIIGVPDYTPEEYRGKQTTYSFGINYGF